MQITMAYRFRVYSICERGLPEISQNTTVAPINLGKAYIFNLK